MLSKQTGGTRVSIDSNRDSVIEAGKTKFAVLMYSCDKRDSIRIPLKKKDGKK